MNWLPTIGNLTGDQTCKLLLHRTMLQATESLPGPRLYFFLFLNVSSFSLYQLLLSFSLSLCFLPSSTSLSFYKDFYNCFEISTLKDIILGNTDVKEKPFLFICYNYSYFMHNKFLLNNILYLLNTVQIHLNVIGV